MTPLARKLVGRIQDFGPITVADYMAACLSDPQHGYYSTREPFGVAGDFVTAPEVSQMFGELIGLWAVEVWQRMGRPRPFLLAELGPGRGTLMADALRAARLSPDFEPSARIVLVETSARLRAIQRATLPRRVIEWVDRIEDLPHGPAIVIANEFFDALPVRQFARTTSGWAERMVGVADGTLAVGRRPAPPPEGADPHLPPGTVVELCAAGVSIMAALAQRLASAGGALLAIDYGHDGGHGDTLQAIRSHRFDPPLAHPGEADITAHVDFRALARTAAEAGATVAPLATQAEFLLSLGLLERAGRLGAGKDAAAQAAIQAAVERLAGPSAMGTLFKVLRVAGSGLELAGEPGLAPPEIILQEEGHDAMRLTADALLALPGIEHGFFTRRGGVSSGLYASLNCGTGSSDDRAHIAENRARVAVALGVGAERLATPHQVHSADAVIVDEPWPLGEGPKADAVVTSRPGLAVGVGTADCGPVLFADGEARVVGAAHAGWKGALSGILEATLAAMEARGAARGRIVAVLGPTISASAYEVGPEFHRRFADADPDNHRFFAPSDRPLHFRFDLPAYIGKRLRRAGVGAFVDLGLCTYADPERFFSYRRMTHRGEADYGRLLHAIAIAG